MPPPVPLGQGEQAKCQKWLPSSPESTTGEPPKRGNEASSPGGRFAQLRGHWAKLEKTGAACDMFVMSAYPPDEDPVATGKMKFNVAVALVLAGKKPKFPPGKF
jgi:hypothetical protein